MASRAFIVLALAAVAFGGAAAAFDCEAGCPLTGVGACGANGITFINRCLAECSGAAVAHDGACNAYGPAGKAPAAGETAAASVLPASAQPLDKHPIGQFLALGGDAPEGVVTAAAGSPVALSPVRASATAADIRRYAHEGFALVGPARMGSFRVTKPAGNTGGSVSAAAKGENGEIVLFTVRVVPEEGLVYASTKPLEVPSASADFVPSKAPSVSASAASEEAVASTPQQPTRPAPASAKLRAAGWVEVNGIRDHPFKAIGWLNVGFSDGAGSCSGSVFGTNAVVTAGHCVYDRYSRTTISRARFTAHNFYTARGQLKTPYGSVNAAAYDFMAGWASEDMNEAWVGDMAVILLQQDVGTTVGMLGFGYNNTGYTGTIWAAGYPGESPRYQGQYYRLKGICNIADVDGTDGQLDLKQPGQTTCLTPCSIAEQGQSGQPAYIQSGDNFILRAVLSHGPPAGECYGFDTYTEVTKAHFAFLQKYREWKPKA